LLGMLEGLHSGWSDVSRLFILAQDKDMNDSRSTF